MPEASRVRVSAAFIAVSLTWGFACLAVRLALDRAAPLVLLAPALRLSREAEVLWRLALLVAAASWSRGSLASRRSDRPAGLLAASAAPMLGGGALLLVAGAAGGDWSRLSPPTLTGSATAAWLHLVLLGSAVAVPAQAPADSSHALIDPAVAALPGGAVAGEALPARTLIALALAVVSVLALLRSGRSSRRRSDAVAPSTPRPRKPAAVRASVALAVVAWTSVASASARGPWLAALKDSDPDVRRLAAQFLAADAPLEPREAAALRERLLDREEHWGVRSAAAGSLSLAAGPEAVAARAALERVGRDDSEDWRLRAAAVQAWFVSDGGEGLRRVLSSRPEDLRLDTPRGVLPLDEPDLARRFLGDPAPCLRRVARLALAFARESPEPDERTRRSVRLIEY